MGRRGRPALSSQTADRQGWLATKQSQRSMDVSDPADSEDGLSVARSLGPNDGVSAASSDQALAATTSTSEDTSDSQGSVG